MKIIAAGVFLLASVSFSQLRCEYKEGVFEVTEEKGTVYRQKVAPHSYLALYACGNQVAGIYDGWDLTIFDGRTKKFTWVKAKPAYDRSQLLVSENLLGFYDGDHLHIYSDHLTSIPTMAYTYGKLAVSAQTA